MADVLSKRVIIPEFRFSNPKGIETVNGARANAKRLDGISTRFRIEKYMNAVMNKATIQLANLAREDIEYLTTFTSWAFAIEKRKRIRLFAGYENQNVGLIFDGDITKATPTMPPDIWLECEALSGFYDNQNVLSISIAQETSLRSICEEAAQQLGLSLKFYSENQKTIDGFTYCGGARNILYKINDLFQVCAYEENRKLYVRDLYPTSKYVNAKLISENSGLIGIPQPGPMGVDLTVLLDPTIELGAPIQLKSRRIPAADGIYYPYAMIYEGASRENPFYTHLRCRRYDA